MLNILAPARPYISPSRPFPAVAIDTRPELDEFEPEERLAVAIIRRALYDLTGASLYHRYDALKYFRGPNFAADCAALGLGLHDMQERVNNIWRQL